MQKKLRPLMFVGTGSDVGKSVVNTAFCRIFSNLGYTPAPFKAQNMSLNSYPTPDGLEIGRAQAVQAEACRLDCSVDMNPILLKPNTAKSMQVILMGKPVGNYQAQSYFKQSAQKTYFDSAVKAFNKLNENHSPIIIEGAGSISEVNLWDKDIVNMPIAAATNASTYLVADIDKGGVIASTYGSIKLLPENHRKLIKGIIINKFRGDIELFKDGIKIIEELCEKPVVGVIPYFRDIYIEQEDAVDIKHRNSVNDPNKVNIAVVLLPHMSNFTDFNVIEKQDSVHMYYADSAKSLNGADIIILPGTKNTIDDLNYLKSKEIDKAIINKHTNGTAVYGICGGFQMMGETISDPNEIESNKGNIEGLGLLPTHTTIQKQKLNRQVEFNLINEDDTKCHGYEIHMGETLSNSPSPLCKTNYGDDGYFVNNKTWGTYIHGIFDNSTIIEKIIQNYIPNYKLEFNYKKYKDDNYNLLAEEVQKACDMDYILKSLE